jgi:DNA-binding response OmpR family regulator
MARVLLLTGDLLFGSNLQGALTAAGHSVELLADGPRLERALSDPAPGPPQLLVIDLTDPALAGAEVYASLPEQARLLPSLGFHSHVDPASREQGEAAGIGQVVPRSRMAREAPALVERLLASAPVPGA